MAGYGDNTGFAAYAAERGYTVPEGATAEQITAARLRGAMAVDRYEPQLSGTRTGGYQQELAWPRSNAVTSAGETIASDAVPVAVVQASYEAALIELATPGRLFPVVTGSEAVKRETVGALEVEYLAPNATSPIGLASLATPVVTAVEALLKPFFQRPVPAIWAV
jgi:hypothetical protein